MSTTARPVTQVALTAVNSATRGAGRPVPGAHDRQHQQQGPQAAQHGERQRDACGWASGARSGPAAPGSGPRPRRRPARRRGGRPGGRAPGAPASCWRRARSIRRRGSLRARRRTMCARLFTRGPAMPVMAASRAPSGTARGLRWAGERSGGRDRRPHVGGVQLRAGPSHGADPGPARPAPGRGLRAAAGAQRRPDPRGGARRRPRPGEGARPGLPDRGAHGRAHRRPRRPAVRDGHRRRARCSRGCTRPRRTCAAPRSARSRRCTPGAPSTR